MSARPSQKKAFTLTEAIISIIILGYFVINIIPLMSKIHHDQEAIVQKYDTMTNIQEEINLAKNGLASTAQLIETSPKNAYKVYEIQAIKFIVHL